MKRIAFFERYLSFWVLLCIGAGIMIGQWTGDSIHALSDMNWHQVNLPVALLIWLMIYPMMLQIDFSKIRNFKQQLRGISLTVVVNWLIKPFSMAFIAWLFFNYIFGRWLSPEEIDQYTAGAILLGAAPCTAMVFVWSYLSDGDPNYTLMQVAINDLIILIAFIPIVELLLGITGLHIPFEALLASVLVFVVIPLLAGFITQKLLLRSKGDEWFRQNFLPFFRPVSMIALLLTLILLFAFQGEKILANPLHILLIAVPLIIQTYFIFSVAWNIGRRLLKLPYAVCAPGSMIGASNFFELSVAVAIVLFGINSGAALATVVGVLIEVPIMLSLVAIANKKKY